MSFGFGVGDFIAVLQLANKVRRDFSGAPQQFKAISDEVRSLSILLQDVDVAFSESEASDLHQTNMRDILGSCYNVLFDIEKLLNKNVVMEATGSALGDRVKRVWKRTNWQPGDIQELRDRLASNVGLLHAFLGRISSGVALETMKVVNRLDQRQEDQHRKHILDWITPIDYTSQHSDYFARQEEGTGQWLLDSQEYSRWAEEPGKTLFCPGIPGSGKTILASIVINNLGQRFGNDPNTGIAYLYCNFRRQDEQTVDHFLASILRQLAQDQVHLSSIITELFGQLATRREQLGQGNILEAIRSVASTFTRVFIVVDALDECSTNNGCLAKLLSELFSLQAAYQVNIFATSRMIPEITESFTGSVLLEIRARDEDVQSYIESHISHLGAFVRSNLGLQREITMKIIEAVNGMFLLAQLYLDSLKGKKSPKALRVALGKMSAGSDAYSHAYHDAMERIEGQLLDEQELAKQALSWIVSARKPLTTGELQHALATEVDEDELDEDNISRIEDVVSVCAGLITVDEETDIIRLVHYTTQDYFEREQVRWFPNAAADISTVCVTYLSLGVFGSGPCPTRDAYKKRLHLYRLFAYAALHWGHHARDSTSRVHQIDTFLQKEDQVDAAAQVLLHEYDRCKGQPRQEDSPRYMTGLHLAAYFGLKGPIPLLLAKTMVDERTHFDQVAICFAAMNGHESVVNLLLEKGADVNSRGKENQTPLLYAAEENHEGVIKLLLNHGADLESRAMYKRTPLHWAVVNDNETMVKLLLEKGAYLESRAKYDQTPLHRAAICGHEATTRVLLEAGADVNSVEEDDDTPLHYAAMFGYETTAKLLLENGADVNSRTWNKATPLHNAAKDGHEMTVKLLLEKGADVNSQTRDGATPLDTAVREAKKKGYGKGYEATIKFLLENSALREEELPL